MATSEQPPALERSVDRRPIAALQFKTGQRHVCLMTRFDPYNDHVHHVILRVKPQGFYYDLVQEAVDLDARYRALARLDGPHKISSPHNIFHLAWHHDKERLGVRFCMEHDGDALEEIARISGEDDYSLEEMDRDWGLVARMVNIKEQQQQEKVPQQKLQSKQQQQEPERQEEDVEERKKQWEPVTMLIKAAPHYYLGVWEIEVMTDISAETCRSEAASISESMAQSPNHGGTEHHHSADRLLEISFLRRGLGTCSYIMVERHRDKMEIVKVRRMFELGEDDWVPRIEWAWDRVTGKPSVTTWDPYSDEGIESDREAAPATAARHEVKQSDGPVAFDLEFTLRLNDVRVKQGKEPWNGTGAIERKYCGPCSARRQNKKPSDNKGRMTEEAKNDKEGNKGTAHVGGGSTHGCVVCAVHSKIAHALDNDRAKAEIGRELHKILETLEANTSAIQPRAKDAAEKWRKQTERVALIKLTKAKYDVGEADEAAEAKETDKGGDGEGDVTMEDV